jgi:signal peptidase I
MGGALAVVIAVVALASVLVVARLLFFVVRVDGASMVPTFRPGEAVLAIRRPPWRSVRRDDIVVCRLPRDIAGPDALLIKRVTAIAGEPAGAGVVPSGRVFIRGDGTSSYDSRKFGPIPVACVVGRVVARLSRGGLHQADQIVESDRRQTDHQPGAGGN